MYTLISLKLCSKQFLYKCFDLVTVLKPLYNLVTVPVSKGFVLMVPIMCLVTIGVAYTLYSVIIVD